MAKQVASQLKLQIPAGKANPAPPVGPALGQRGVNIMEFCKDFNARTKKMEAGMPVSVLLSVYEDRSFDFIVKTPLASHLIKKAIKLDKGGATPGRESAGTISKAQCRQVAEAKLADLNTTDLDAATLIIMGTARSMGLDVSE